MHAAAAQTADEVIERHLAAIGGRAALEKLASRVATGTITLTTPAGDLSGPVEIFDVAPNKERTLISLDLSALGAGKMTVDRRFDGATGYVIDTLQGNREVTGTELDNMRNQANFRSPFLNYKQAGMSVTLKGREKVGDRDAYRPARRTEKRVDGAGLHRCPSVPGAQVRLDGSKRLRSASSSRPLSSSTTGTSTGSKCRFRSSPTSSVQSFTIVFTTKAEHNVTVDPSDLRETRNTDTGSGHGTAPVTYG